MLFDCRNLVVYDTLVRALSSVGRGGSSHETQFHAAERLTGVRPERYVRMTYSRGFYRKYKCISAPVAQLDRVLASEAKGRWFDSSRAHQRPRVFSHKTNNLIDFSRILCYSAH